MQNQYKNSAISPKPLVLVSMANSVPDSNGPASTSQRLDLVLQTALSLQTVYPPPPAVSAVLCSTSHEEAKAQKT